jgi:hypothetical protein
MRACSDDFKNYSLTGVLTLAQLWRITRKDGEIFGFTDHDRDIEYNGLTYLAAKGYLPSAIAQGSSLAVDNLDVVTMIDAGYFTEEDIQAGIWDNAVVDIYLIDYEHTDRGIMILAEGWKTGEFNVRDQEFSVEIRSKTQQLQQTIVEITSPECRASLGDERCQIALQPDQWSAKETMTLGEIRRPTTYDGKRYVCIGMFKDCLQFDGDDDYVDCGNHFSFPGAMTWEFWFKSSAETEQMMLGKLQWSDYYREYFIRLNIYGQFQFVAFEDGAEATLWARTTPLSYNDGYWHHGAITYDGITFKIFIDGEEVVSVAETRNVHTSTKKFSIGRQGEDAVQYFEGYIDEVRIWNDVRTEQEIQANMYLELEGTESGLIGYYKMNEGSGDVMGDSSSSGYNGTREGATWASPLPKTGEEEPDWDDTPGEETQDGDVLWLCHDLLEVDPWQAEEEVSLGEIRRATTYDYRQYVCIIAGTCGATEPSWDTTPGETTEDGTVIWLCISAWHKEAAVTGVTDRREFEAVSLADEDGAFAYGVLLWLTGENAGYEMEVKNWILSTHTMVLFEKMPFEIAIGDTFAIDIGCDRRLATCKTRFGNVINFRGEPYLPGTDEVYRYTT